jgi:hypothetical protein
MQGNDQLPEPDRGKPGGPRGVRRYGAPARVAVARKDSVRHSAEELRPSPWGRLFLTGSMVEICHLEFLRGRGLRHECRFEVEGEGPGACGPHEIHEGYGVCTGWERRLFARPIPLSS